MTGRDDGELRLAAATLELSKAMMSLGTEHPAERYTQEGYTIWLRSVAKKSLAAAEHRIEELTAERDEALAASTGRATAELAQSQVR